MNTFIVWNHTKLKTELSPKGSESEVDYVPTYVYLKLSLILGILLGILDTFSVSEWHFFI